MMTFLKKLRDSVRTKNKLKAALLELEKLKAEVDSKDPYTKIFIEQAPTAIAMLDKNMHYIAVSKQWISDFKMEGKEIIGQCHYDTFPEIGDEWKANHKKCLEGAIDTNDGAPFVRADGSVQWIYWDVRPWYISEGNVGGLIMHTGDITHLKEKEEEQIFIEKILDKTNEVARIGTWDIDLIKNTLFWSKMVCKIHEVPENYVPDLEAAIDFFKEGESRDTIRNAVNEAIEKGIAYDVEVELVTAKNNIKWARAIGQAEFVNGKCVRLFGVFQDVNEIKLSQLALNKAHTELKAIFNSRAVAIVAIDMDGIISQFNRGAEILTGYTAEEMIGLQSPKFFHFQEELDKFRIDVAKRYNKNPIGFSAQLEMSKHNAYDTREWNYKRKDGSSLPVLLTLTSMKDEQDKLIGFLGISTDISELKKAENELIKKNQLLSFAEKITMMGNWQWNTLTNNVKWSANLYTIFGVEENTAITYDTYFSFVHPEDKETVTQHVARIFKEKKYIDLMHRIILSNGTVKTVQLLAEVITDDFDNVIEVIGTCQDVTEQKIAENKLQSLAQKLTSQNNQLADFAHITSHNLRAPVSNLNSLLDFYNTAESEQEKKSLFEKFEKVIHHLTLTLNTLVESLRTKNVSLEDLEEVSFEEVLHKTKEILSGEIINTSAIITCDFSKMEKIVYNKLYLESIFLNLLSNSMKYKSASRDPEIFIESDVKDGKVTLQFKDNGLGIDLEKHGHKLFGLNKTFHRHKEAKGVGLFMTKTQIEAMGGVISASSVVHEGTTFHINLN
ncbi:PAS domain S-box protein [Cellulophaga sp. Hel_I_12]|uniref:PAS domain S-box protein n=1 Tax=Cellulophaga sp. Hel_I_12 TaxID=1249972 RepID=UPI0009DF5E7F|nr:PAS domain S-box protein [Cellulophaga sp. Hel_I_12]